MRVERDNDGSLPQNEFYQRILTGYPKDSEAFATNTATLSTHGNQKRLAHFLFPHNLHVSAPELPSPLLTQFTLELAFAAIPHPEAVADPRPVYSIHNSYPDSPLIVTGKVFTKPNEPFSADTIFHASKDILRQDEKWRIHRGLVADGSSMLLPTDYLETMVPDMVKTCTFTFDGKKHFRPDVFWRYALDTILGSNKPPSPPEFIVNPNLKRASFLDNSYNIFQRASRDPDPLLNLNIKLWEYMSAVFPPTDRSPGFDINTYHLYPSGVLEIFMYDEPLNEIAKAALLTNASDNSISIGTGDVTLSVMDNSQGRMQYMTNPNVVRDHDHARVLAGMDLDGDPKGLEYIAKYRIPFTGNFPAPIQTMSLMQSMYFSPINSGPLWTTGGSRVAVMYTDGIPTENMILASRDAKYNSPDGTATKLVRDPYAAILASIYDFDVLRQGNRRTDDMAYLIFADQTDLQYSEYLFTPLFEE